MSRKTFLIVALICAALAAYALLAPTESAMSLCGISCDREAHDAR